MERVRIRSMLNNIKSYQPSLSARKHQDLNNRNCGVEINKNDDEQKPTVHHSCFLLQPLQEDLKDKLNSTIGSEELKKSGNTPTKQASKRRTKIANKSYMFYPLKSKNAYQNLKQLGIKTKTMTLRKQKGIHSTQKYLKFDFEFEKYLNETESNIQNLKKTMKTIENKNPVTHDQHKKTVSAVWRHNFLIKQKQQKQPINNAMQRWRAKKNPYIIQYDNRTKTSRKNSDICPWEFESTNALAL